MYPIFLSAVFACTVTFACFTYIWLNLRYSYWQRHYIPSIKPLPLFGNLKDLILFRISFGDQFQRLYEHPKLKDAPLAGFYVLHRPALLIRNPDLIKLVLIKNFNMFLNRFESADPIHDALGSLTLPLARYPIWRESRKRISEFFTSGRMKQRMYPLMLLVAKDLERYIERYFYTGTATKSTTTTPPNESVIIEVKEMCALFTTDLTTLLSFGIQAHGLKSGKSGMRTQCRNLLRPNFLKVLHFFTIFFMPNLTSYLRAKVFSRDYTNFWRRQVDNIVNSRKMGKNHESDLIDILLKFKEDYKNVKDHFVQHPDFVASQAAIFLLAGFETSSSLIAFALYELSKHPNVQRRLRAELKKNFAKANLNALLYENLASLDYLNMVVAEALRMYPAAAFINRECTLSGNEKGYSLKPFADFVVPRGMPAYISILGLHRDSKYWHNPLHFNPERFSQDGIKRIHPMTYIPFGSGPHGCIGNRLGVLQVKLGLVHILKNYKVERCAQTVSEIKFNPKSFMLEAVTDIHLRFVKDTLTNN